MRLFSAILSLILFSGCVVTVANKGDSKRNEDPSTEGLFAGLVGDYRKGEMYHKHKDLLPPDSRKAFRKSRGKIEGFIPEKLEEQEIFKLSQVLYDVKAYLTPESTSQITAALVKKGMTGDEVELAIAGKIRIGMSRAGMYAAWGQPTDENRTVTAYGVDIQHVYRQFDSYVYTDDGVITSWSN